MTYLSTDQSGTAHIAVQGDDGFWNGLCGCQVGAPEYETETEPRRVGHMLMLTNKGCLRCAREVIPKTKKEMKADG
jgi:hypothetical protein